MTAGGTAKLKIVRHGGFTDRLRSYKIFVNGEQVGLLDRDAFITCDVPCGPVKIEARIDWTRSRPLTFDAVPDQTIEVEIFNPWGPFLALFGVTFGYRRYLQLKRLSS